MFIEFFVAHTFFTQQNKVLLTNNSVVSIYPSGYIINWVFFSPIYQLKIEIFQGLARDVVLAASIVS